MNGFRVDVKLATSADERREIREGVNIRLDAGREIRVARAEDVIAFKLKFGSPQDLQDVRSILVRQEGRLDLERLRGLARELGVEKELERAFEDATKP